jgi:hypothetical protein
LSPRRPSYADYTGKPNSTPSDLPRSQIKPGLLPLLFFLPSKLVSAGRPPGTADGRTGERAGSRDSYFRSWRFPPTVAAVAAWKCLDVVIK